MNVTREDLEHTKQAVVENVTGIFEQAKQYLPQAVTSYFPAVAPKADHINASTTLPSAEVHGDTSGTSRGVGGLPGDVNESAVAKLPEERAVDGTIKDATNVADDTPAIQTTTNTLAHLDLQDAPEPSHPDVTPTQHHSTNDKLASSAAGTGGVGDLPGAASESSVAVLPEEKNLHDSTSTSIKPAPVTTDGVGNLPGRDSESSVAVLPEEKKLHDLTSTSTGSAPVTTGGVGNLPGADSESSVTKLPEERFMEKKTPLAETSKPLPAIATSDVPHSRQPPSSVLSTTAVAGHTPDETPTSTKQDIGHGPSPLHHTSASPNPKARGASDHVKGSSAASSSDAASASSNGSGSTTKKSGFMSKLKGEAKVISGKISGNEEKVEEGKKLLGKI